MLSSTDFYSLKCFFYGKKQPLQKRLPLFLCSQASTTSRNRLPFSASPSAGSAIRSVHSLRRPRSSTSSTPEFWRESSRPSRSFSSSSSSCSFAGDDDGHENRIIFCKKWAIIGIFFFILVFSVQFFKSPMTGFEARTYYTRKESIMI